MNRKLKTLLIVVAILLVLAGSGVAWLYRTLDGSLAQLEGACEVNDLTDSVTIERDANGVPVIHGENRFDVARALGFLHAQERFFQMDLLRRSAAGELSEVVGLRRPRGGPWQPDPPLPPPRPTSAWTSWRTMNVSSSRRTPPGSTPASTRSTKNPSSI